MDVAFETSPEAVDADVLGFAVPEPAELPAAARVVDERFDGRLARLIAEGEVTGSRGELTVVHTADELAARRVAAVGVGDARALDADALRTAAATLATRAGGGRGVTTVGWLLDGADGAVAPAEQARSIVEGVALGRYDAGRWKTEEPRPPIQRVVLCGEAPAGVVAEARRAAAVCDWVNRCRDLVNAPPNEVTPARMAEFAEELSARSPAVSVSTLGPEEIRSAGMGALAAVAQGSHNPPRLIELRYEPEAARGDLVLGLVGKAITFDAGGISLKPPENLEEMKSDMAGGAAVLAAVGAIAELGLPVRVLALVPAAENMPGGHAYRPGDIVTAASGSTIEVVNTDAEGRLILADALWHARGRGVTHLVDLATLTGTIQVAMGDFYAGLFGNEAAWVDRVREAAEASGDHAWPMPLHHTYERHLESSFADLKNAPEKKRGSSIIAALFLQRFAGDGPWAHLDIAGTAFLDRGRDYYPRMGATGYGVRLLTELARGLAERPA